MTKDEVSTILVARNLTVQLAGDDALFVSRQEVKLDVELGPFFEFCSNKLASYSKHLPFDDELVRTIDNLISLYGETSKSEVFPLFHNSKGVVTQKAFRVVWILQSETIYLEIIPEIKDDLKRLILGRKLVLVYEDKQNCK